jgi:hypothetical protein
MSTPAPRWRAWHIFYHSNRNQVLAKLVHPAVGSLLTSGDIDSFFFLRYNLGGPHIRLRLRLVPGRTERVEAHLKEAAAEFFKLWPSKTSLADDLIRRNNIAILKDALLEDDDAVYPDNSLQSFEFRPESERYGGDSLFDASLDFFALSSTLALRFVETHGEMPWGKQLPVIAAILARQAWGLAANKEELLELVDYSKTFWGDTPSDIAAKGDRAFARQAETFLGMFRHRFQESNDLAEGAHHLSKAISSAAPAIRRRILHSHMHLTANRLGLQNREEIYLCRILLRSLERLLESDPRLSDKLDAALERLA